MGVLTDEIMAELELRKCKSLKQVKQALLMIEQKLTNETSRELVSELIAEIEKNKDIIEVYKMLRDMRGQLPLPKP